MGLFSRRTEVRSSGGDFYSTVLRTVELQAATKSADAAATAAVEAAAGLLGRELAQASVTGTQALTPTVLRQIGRDLVRGGASMHRIDTMGGHLRLHPVGQWHWHSGHGSDPMSWTVRATEFGPSGTLAWELPASAVMWLDWAHHASTPWSGRGPLDWAALTARLAANAERSLGSDMSNSVAYALPWPAESAASGDNNDDGEPENNPARLIAADLAAAQGKTVIVPTTKGGFDEGQAEAPSRDWAQVRHGPDPPIANAEIARDAFVRTLAACGVPPSLFTDGADGTAQRESLRRYRMNVVEPVARLIEAEAMMKLETQVVLKFDSYALDVQGRAAAMQKLVVAGIAPPAAAEIVGLLDT